MKFRSSRAVVALAISIVASTFIPANPASAAPTTPLDNCYVNAAQESQATYLTVNGNCSSGTRYRPYARCRNGITYYGNWVWGYPGGSSRASCIMTTASSVGGYQRQIGTTGTVTTVQTYP